MRCRNWVSSQLPPSLLEDVLDHCDQVWATGVESGEMFPSRTSELYCWTDAKPNWLTADIPACFKATWSTKSTPPPGGDDDY